MAIASLDYNSIEELPQRFWDKVSKTESCWIWNGKTDDGYGRFSINKTYYLVHRLTVAVLKEKLIEDMVIDHTCRVRNCCNPDHLEQITKSDNSKRKQMNKDATVCVNGHPLIGDEANTHISIRRTRHDGDVPSITCKVCNSVKRLDKVGE